MNLDQHEKHIKQKLGEQRVSVDTDSLWEVLEEHVPAKKEKRRFGWIFLFGLFAGGLVVFGSLLFTKNLSSTIVVNPDQQTVIATNTINEKNTNNQDNINETQSESIKNNKENAIGQREVINPNKNEIALHTLVELKSNSTSQVRKERVYQNEILKSKNDDKVNLVDPVVSSANVDSYQSASKEQLLNDDSKTVEKGTSFDNGNSADGETNQGVNQHNELPSQEYFDLQNLAILEMNELELNKNDLFGLDVEPFSAHDKVFSAVSFQIGAGLNTIVYANENGENASAYVSRVEKIEATLPEITTGMSLYKELSPRLSIEVGLSYGRYTSRYASDFSNTSQGSIQGVTNVSIDSDGFRSEETGEVETSYYLSYQAVGHSYIHTLDMPVMILYELLSGGGWELSARGGLSLGLIQRSMGYALGDDFTHQAYSATDSPLSSKFNLAPQAGLRITKNINGVQLFSQTMYQTRINQFNNNNIQYDRRINSVSIHFGTQIRL